MGTFLVDGAGDPSRGRDGVSEGIGGAARNEPAARDAPPLPATTTTAVRAWLTAHGTVVLTTSWLTLLGDPAEGT